MIHTPLILRGLAFASAYMVDNARVRAVTCLTSLIVRHTALAQTEQYT